ncbi:MAG TPA: hypothetical protein VN039_11710, partial [Nitrospira sp.]|nr:hypothetical protein [Nitrospira sp.]
MVGLKTMGISCVAAGFALLAALATGGAKAQSIVQPPVASIIDGNGVNLATGKLQLPNLDLGIGGNGSGLARSTNSFLSDTTSTAGTADNFSGSMVVSAPPGGTGAAFTYNISYGGKVYRFLLYYTNGAWLPPQSADGGPQQLNCSDPTPTNGVGTCDLLLEDGTVAHYDEAIGSYLTSITRPNGEVISLTYYQSSGVKAIKSVSSSLGWMLKYEVDGSYKVIKLTGINTAVTYCDPNANSCSVGGASPTESLTVSGSTTTLTRNGVTILNYVSSASGATFTSPNNVSKTVTLYTSGTDNGRVHQVTSGGSTWTYSYVTYAGSGLQTTVQAPNGTSRQTFVDINGKTQWQKDEEGRTTTYVYSTASGAAFGQLVKIVAPDGDGSTGGFTAFSYDSLGRLTMKQVVAKGGASNGIPIAGGALVTSYTYANCDGTNDKWCRKPTAVTDENGVTTNYAYDSYSGEVATALFPAPASGQARPKITYSYSAFTPYVKNSSGALVAQGAVYRLTETSTCRTADNGNCINGGDEKQTIISYAGSNNLLPTSTTVKIGDGSYPQTTTATYDDNGNVIVADGPKSGAVDETYTFYDTLGRVQGAVGVDPDGASGSRHRQASH